MPKQTKKKKPPKDKKIEAKPVTLDALEETLGKQSDTSPTSIKSEADKEKEMDAAYERQQVEEKERIHRANMATLKPFSPSSKNKKEPEQMGLVPWPSRSLKWVILFMIARYQPAVQNTK